MDREEILSGAFTFTSVQVGSDACTELGVNRLRVFSKTILAHLSEDDRAGLFVPVKFARDGKEHPGCILTLEDRAVFTWSTGTLRVRNFGAVIPYTTVRDIEEATDPVTIRSGSLGTIYMQAEEDWTVIVPNELDGEGMSVPALLKFVLYGAVSFEYDAPSGEVPGCATSVQVDERLPGGALPQFEAK